MDLQLAAHGLNLSTASRVYFIQQCWSGATESQAIKRAHRIGQTRPVNVEILVLKGTIEEAMQKRRMKLTGRELGDTKSITDDAVLRNAIKNPKFMVDPEHQELLDPQFPLFFIGGETGTGEDGLAPVDAEEATPTRVSQKRKQVAKKNAKLDLPKPTKRARFDGQYDESGSPMIGSPSSSTSISTVSDAPHIAVLSPNESHRNPFDQVPTPDPSPTKKRRKVLRFSD